MTDDTSVRNRIMVEKDGLEHCVDETLNRIPHDRLFVLTDSNTFAMCWPVLQAFPCMRGAQVITIPAGDEHKDMRSMERVWSALQQGGASRRSVLVNLGGGMVTDLGGFAASTFKRGIPYVNIPTTLLSMVDASVGGKTGINFGGLKNEVGLFSEAQAVLLDCQFLSTLNDCDLRSGYAEMLKHGLIDGTERWAELLAFDLDKMALDPLRQMVDGSVRVKERIVAEDPTERGLRKALNLGHTAGHALESLALHEGRPIPHGYAVAWGLVCELYLSATRLGFPHDRMWQTLQFVKEHYGVFDFDCKKYDLLYEYMQHDKKNEGGLIHFTLLSEVGEVHINQVVTKEEIYGMLDFYRESMGC